MAEKYICQVEDWYNAFGEPSKLQIGQRLTMNDSRYVGGARFIEFVEYPGNWYWDKGFKPLRSLN